MNAKISDVRENSRYRVSYKWIKLLSGRSEYIGIVSNISNTGMMVSGNLDFSAGESIHIGLQDDHLIGGRVKWRKDKCAGIAFDEPIEVQDFFAKSSANRNDMRSRSPRFKRTTALSVRTNSGTHSAHLIDISPSGLCIGGISGLRVNQTLYLDLGPLGHCRGQVRWTDRETAGIALARTLRFAQLSEWLAQSSVRT